MQGKHGIQRPPSLVLDSRTLDYMCVSVQGDGFRVNSKLIIPKRRIPAIAIIAEINRSLFEELRSIDPFIDQVLLRAFRLAATNVAVFTSGTTTWPMPSGWTTALAEVELLGGGGGGGTGNTGGTDAGGGGGSGAAEVKIQRWILSGNKTVVIGAGGGSHAVGNNSTFTTDGDTMTALGGNFGGNSTSNVGGTGAAAVGTGGGTTNSSWGHVGVGGGAGGNTTSTGSTGSAPVNGFTGGAPGTGVGGTGAGGGGGGSTHRAQGGTGSNAGNPSTTPSAPTANSGAGGGGSGGTATGSPTSAGSGASGYCVVLSMQAS